MSKSSCIHPSTFSSTPLVKPDASAHRDSRVIWMLIGASSIFLLAISTLRHWLFRSGAMDLAFFDQLAFLISRGQMPISSFTGYHLLGDHAAYVMYLIAPLYRVVADVHVLLIVQALALSIGAYPLWRIALLEGLTRAQANAVALAYLLYPLMLAANVFDFHPEVLAVPALLFAVLAVKRDRLAMFIASILVALGGKEVVGLTVAAMGFWLLVFEKKRAYGTLALVMGLGWFVFATRFVIPAFGAGKEASGVRLFTYLGSSVPEIIVGLITHPERWIGHVLRFKVAIYLAVIFGPVCWGLAPTGRALAVLLAAAPTMALNVLADPSTGENLLAPFSHYSLLVAPFVALSLVYGVASGRCFLTRPRFIAAWSVALLFVGLVGRLAIMNRGGGDLADDRMLTLESIKRLDRSGALLTTHEIAPHVSHRRMVQYVGRIHPMSSLDHFDYVLLNRAHGSLRAERDLTEQLVRKIESGRYGRFERAFEKDSTVLYRRDPFDRPWSAWSMPSARTVDSD
jgi:uncharacterized membrane protein